MGGYGYSYQAYSSYSSGGLGKSEETLGPLIRKPFVPFVPGRNSDRYSAPTVNRSSETQGHVTKKTVPVACSPYGYGDEYKHSSSSPKQAYPSRIDEGWRQQTSPVHGRPQKVDDFLNKIQIQASRPAKFDPATNWRDSQQSPPYNGANGYRDSSNFSSKPTGNTMRNDQYDGYNGARGYGDSGVYGIQGNGYGGDYRNKDNEFGSDYGYYGKKEGYKSTGDTIWKENNDAYNGTNGYGDYGKNSNTEGLKPTGNITWNDNHDRYQPAVNYSAVEPNKPTMGGWTPSPRNGYGGDYRNKDNGFGSDYGYYGKKEGYKSTGDTIWKENNDAYNGTNGYGDYGKNNKTEGLKPTGNITWNDNHGRYQPAVNYSAVEPNKPTMGGWTPPPRNGTHLTEATNDIGKAMELLNPKLAPSGHSTGVIGGINGNGGYGEYGNKDNGFGGDHGYYGKKEGYKPTVGTIWKDNNDGYNGTSGYSDYGEYGNTGIKPTGNTTRNDNYDRPNPSSNLDKATKLVKEADGLKPIVTASPKGRGSLHSEPTNKIDQTSELAEGIKNIVTAPTQTRPVAIEETMPNKDDYRENIDTKEATKGSGKFNFAPRPREANYRENIAKSDAPRRFGNLKFGPIINSTEAERKYNGARV